ncbi:MAG: hypothetical protein U0872_13400 [Planctomycetaceae bacterium]
MSVEPPRPSDSYVLWLVLSGGLVACAAVFAAARIKPPVIFAAGFGLAIGLALRSLAVWLQVPLGRRVIWAALLLSAVGFGLCFALSYRRAELDWRRIQAPEPEHAALAEALLKNFPGADAESPRSLHPTFSFHEYLSGRYPDWRSSWPYALWGAEWALCVAITGLCLYKRRRTAKDQLAESAP